MYVAGPQLFQHVFGCSREISIADFIAYHRQGCLSQHTHQLVLSYKQKINNSLIRQHRSQRFHPFVCIEVEYIATIREGHQVMHAGSVCQADAVIVMPDLSLQLECHPLGVVLEHRYGLIAGVEHHLHMVFIAKADRPTLRQLQLRR